MRGLLKTAAIATMVMLTSVPTSEAVDTYWIPASGYWDAAGNWDNGLPTSANDAYVASAHRHHHERRRGSGELAVHRLWRFEPSR